jgi:FAD/FMN-containing dehydrogenase
METRLFSFSSFTDASDFVTRIFESNLLPAAVELINSHEVGQLPFPDLFGSAPGGYGVAVALEDFRESVERMKSEMTEMVSGLAHKGETGLEEKEHGNFWAAVSNTDRSLFKRFNGLITARISYPLSEWKSLIPFTDKTLSSLGTGHVLQTHAGSGVCRISLLTDNPEDNPEGETLEKAIQALGKISKYCSRIGGTLFITRAPASLRKHFSGWGEPGPELLVMKRIKEHLDPSGVMCPAPFMGDL